MREVEEKQEEEGIKAAKRKNGNAHERIIMGAAQNWSFINSGFFSSEVTVKKKIAVNRQNQNFPYSPSEFKEIRPYREYEIEPVLSKLYGKNMAEHPKLAEPKRFNRYLNESVTRYILIRNVGALEYYLRQIASKFVDENNVSDFSKFFSNDFDFETTFAESNRDRGRRKN